MTSSHRRLAFGFVAGFVAVFVFHQVALALLWGAGVAPAAPYSMAPTAPLGVPAVLSAAFWGGVWGVIYALVDGRFPRGRAYWGTAFLFGAIFPTLVALLIVVPLKGGPIGAGWQPQAWLVPVLVNGAWGLGTGIVLHLLSRRPREARA